MLAVQVVAGILVVVGILVAVYFRLKKNQSNKPTQHNDQPHYYGERDEMNEHRFSRYRRLY